MGELLQMGQRVEELYSLLIPLHQGRLIVPRSCVAEVVRYTEPEERPNGPAWFRGHMSWNELEIPVIRVEELSGLEPVAPGGRTRLAIFHCATDSLSAGFFGVLTEGFPQLVRVNRDVLRLEATDGWPDDAPVLCRVKMINEFPLIPDLEKLELMLARQAAGT